MQQLGRMKWGFVLVCSLVAMWSVACSRAQPDEPAPTPAQPSPVVNYSYKVIQSYPHDRRAFTQGLVYEDGVLYESTGLYGQSALARRDLKTGKTLKVTRLAKRHFGEGIALFEDKIIQLTWRENAGFVYKKDTFTLLQEFTYPTEGWGITHDGKRLIYSDGTATLRFLDPNTFTETSRIEVQDQGQPVRGLNELEFIPGQAVGDEAGGGRLETGGSSGLQPTVSGLILANVWPTDQIVVIDPKTGRVVGRLDLSKLYPRPEDSEAVLNGIAWIPETNHLLVTGKLWPKVYEIELMPLPPDKNEK